MKKGILIGHVITQKNSNDTEEVKFKQFKLFHYYLTTLPTHCSFVDVAILRQPLIFSNNFVELRRIMVAYLMEKLQKCVIATNDTLKNGILIGHFITQQNSNDTRSEI